ncbi:RNase H domain-containing protein [Trichonephila clavipes]|nr:RNase H domain-containing protein [Trichonephila clavipes]
MEDGNDIIFVLCLKKTVSNCKRVIEVVKENASIHITKREYWLLKGTRFCYTDGSKIDGRVGFAFVVFRSGVESENFQFRIRDECTVFVAELLCLNFAVKWITEQNSVISEYLICTDSLSSLDSLKCISSSNNIIVEIQKQLKSLRDKNISIDFAFVRGHTGVLGNERADWLAKAATKRKIDIDVNIPKSFYKKITNEIMMKSWNQEYLISNKGSLTKNFFSHH